MTWTRLKAAQKQGYHDAYNLAIQMYKEFCTGGKKQLEEMTCLPSSFAYQQTKAGQIEKANRIRVSRCRSSKHQRSPADYASPSHFQSFIKQMRVAIGDELSGERPDFQTSRTLKDIWDKLSEEERQKFMENNSRNKWLYLAHWERWLRNRYCKGNLPHNVISRLPQRPKSAFKYFYDH